MERGKGVEKVDEGNKASNSSAAFVRDGDYLEAVRAHNKKPLHDPTHPRMIEVLEELENAAELQMDSSKDIQPKPFYNQER